MPQTPLILFEDTHLMVLSKPAGLLSQGEISGDANLVDWLREYLGRPYVGLIHRLDRNTSGIMIVGKRTKSSQRLSEQLQNGTLSRTYRAWLLGRMKGQPERWSHFLWKDEKRNQVRVVPSDYPGAKSSALKVIPLASGALQGRELTLAEFQLETGRSHQIRVQSAAEGFPLLGDTKYGAKENSGIAFARPALHSFRLTFEHPMSKEPMSFEDPLPEDMRGIAQRPLS